MPKFGHGDGNWSKIKDLDCNYYYDDGESKSSSKESSYLDKNKENNSYNDNTSAE